MPYVDSMTQLFGPHMIANDRNPAQTNLNRKGGFYGLACLHHRTQDLGVRTTKD